MVRLMTARGGERLTDYDLSLFFKAWFTVRNSYWFFFSLPSSPLPSSHSFSLPYFLLLPLFLLLSPSLPPFFLFFCITLLGLPQQSTTDWVTSKKRNLFSQSSGSISQGFSRAVLPLGFSCLFHNFCLGILDLPCMAWSLLLLPLAYLPCMFLWLSASSPLKRTPALLYLGLILIQHALNLT